MKLNLTLPQTRVIGVLIEKEITTPDQYPLTPNSLMTGCNQKSSRDPVMNLSQNEVQDIVEELKGLRIVLEQTGHGSRVSKIKHRFCNTEFSDLKFTAQELGVICVLFLRGPQSPGELRTRTNRLCQFTDTLEVEAVLESLANRDIPLVVRLHKEAGKREHRWAHLFSGEVDLGTVVESAPARQSSQANNDYEQRISDLEQQVKTLSAHITRLNEELGLDPIEDEE